MIAPGGKPGVTFGRSATTRFNNNQIEAQQRSMPHNKAAQASLRRQVSGSKAPKKQAVGKKQPQQNNPPVGNVNIPTGGPQMPAPEQFDPRVFVEQEINDIVGQMKFDEFANSPQTKDAMTAIKLKNFFNRNNPEYRPDIRPLIDQIGTRTGADQ